MTSPVTLRGRAATPVRPGLVVKSVLMGVTPLATGELVALLVVQMGHFMISVPASN